VLAHVYSTGDPQSYQFTVQNPGQPICGPPGSFGSGASAGILYLAMLYRGADQNLSQFAAYGFPGSDNSNQFSTSTISPPTGKLVGVFSLSGVFFGNGPGTGGNFTSFAAPQGTPILLPETPLNGVTSDGGIFGADAPVTTTGQLFGGYSTSTNINCADSTGLNYCNWLGWEVLLPSQ
jgi:hypothetical protein